MSPFQRGWTSNRRCTGRFGGVALALLPQPSAMWSCYPTYIYSHTRTHLARKPRSEARPEGLDVSIKLLKDLPRSFTDTLPHGVQSAYAIIPKISSLPEPQRAQVRAVFARATKLIWQVMIGFSGAGLLTVVLMREEQMRRDRDEQWGSEGERREFEAASRGLCCT